MLKDYLNGFIFLDIKLYVLNVKAHYKGFSFVIHTPSPLID